MKKIEILILKLVALTSIQVKVSMKKSIKSQWPQWLAAFQVSLIMFMEGLITGWPTPYLAKLTDRNSEFHITAEQASWIASMTSICKVLGDIIGIVCLHHSGCKMTIYLSGFPFALSWLCFFFKHSVVAIYVGRILSGIATGIVVIAFPLYIGEIADPKIRARLINFIALNLMLGITASNIMGNYLDMHIFALISLVPNVVFLCSFVFLPPSPYYLIKQSRMGDAAKSIKWYNRDADAETDLKILEKFIRDHKSRSFLDALRDLKTPINRNAFLMIATVSFGGAFSGYCTVVPYLQIILQKSRVTIIEPSTAAIIVSSVGILAMFASVYTSDKFERKLLLALSCGTIAVLFTIWGFYFIILDLGFDNSHLQWIPLACAVLNKIAITQGVAFIVIILRSELLAPNVKGVACGILGPLGSFFAFAATKSYQPLVDVLTEKYVFFLHALVMFLTCLYAIFCLPATKGKSLPEIQEMIAHKFRVSKNYSVYSEVRTYADDDLSLKKGAAQVSISA